MKFLRLPAVGAVVVVVATSGCGGSGGSNGQSNATPSSGSVLKTVTIHETEYKLTPSTVSLDKPGTYVFKAVNGGTVAHALAVEGQGIHQKIASISPGKSGALKVTLGKGGTYTLYCPIDGHRGLGMEGKITVGGGASGTTTTGTSTSRGGGY
jgi:uncharacterized cupredoxin-like copper-binding protein